MNQKLAGIIIILTLTTNPTISSSMATNPIVDTGQTTCYDNYSSISCPGSGGEFQGQDANYSSNSPSYQDNNDGTVTDLVTGLIWSKGVEETKVSLVEAEKIASGMTLGGYTDWRVPNIKELYSLINFSGNTGSHQKTGRYSIPSDSIPFINTDYFDFRYGNTSSGERYIDGQWLSSTKYVSTTMGGQPTLFGVNFADGRIKGYPNGGKTLRGTEKKYYVRYVRGAYYGNNQFIDNGNGTISDETTGLMWQKQDSLNPMNWQEALNYAEKLEYAGYGDWRLPNAKELQYLVDYSRSPDTTNSAAIDPIFQTTSITNEAGEKDYPFYWTSTTHTEGSHYNRAAYISFGRAIGQMRDRVMDVHGAGAQRSDSKNGGASLGNGPQGDAARGKNFVRLVRGGKISSISGKPAIDKDSYPHKIKVLENTKKNNQPFSQTHQSQGPPSSAKHTGPPPKSRGAAHFINRLDRDGDGVVSKSEFDGPKDHFAHLDTNHDGYLSESEAPQGPPRRRHK